MFTFTFDHRIFFDRQPFDDCWYAYTHPLVNVERPNEFRHGYFRVADGLFARDAEDDRSFSDGEKREIERTLADHMSDMDLAQFDGHKEVPPHYKEISHTSNRYNDLLSRTRHRGCWDPEFSVAFEDARNENPAYRLNRGFVLVVLDRASRVSEKRRNSWLRDSLKDTWDHDMDSDERRGKTFESFCEEEVKCLLFPHPIQDKKYAKYRIYAIDGLPSIYCHAEVWDSGGGNLIVADCCYYHDRDTAIVPIPLPSRYCIL